MSYDLMYILGALIFMVVWVCIVAGAVHKLKQPGMNEPENEDDNFNSKDFIM